MAVFVLAFVAFLVFSFVLFFVTVVVATFDEFDSGTGGYDLDVGDRKSVV